MTGKNQKNKNVANEGRSAFGMTRKIRFRSTTTNTSHVSNRGGRRSKKVGATATVLGSQASSSNAPRQSMWNLDSLLVSCVVLLLCLQNTLMTIDFENLKYIKKIFKIPT